MNSAPDHAAPSEAPRPGRAAAGSAGVIVAGRLPWLDFHLRPRTVAKVLVSVIVVLITLGTVANIVIYHVAPDPDHRLARLMHRFDLGFEPSLANWYSSLVLLLNAVVVGIVALLKRQTGQPLVKHWCALSGLMLFMAVDEAIMIHEMFDKPLRELLNTGGLLYFAWVIPGSILVALVGIGFAGFLREIDPRTRRLFIAAGTVFVVGAIGMELLAGLVMSAHGSEAAGVFSYGHTFEQAVEEALEMVGALVFLYAVLDLLSRELGGVRLKFWFHE